MKQNRDLRIMDTRNRLESKLYEIKKNSLFIKKTIDSQASRYLDERRNIVIDTDYLNIMFKRLLWSLAEMTIIGDELNQSNKKKKEK